MAWGEDRRLGVVGADTRRLHGGGIKRGWKLVRQTAACALPLALINSGSGFDPARLDLELLPLFLPGWGGLEGKQNPYKR